MKPQFTEEEARDMYFSTIKKNGVEDFIESLNKAGYIRKSELEILVEEADRYFEKRDMCDPLDLDIVATKQNECIQAMKVELNKRREG